MESRPEKPKSNWKARFTKPHRLVLFSDEDFESKGSLKITLLKTVLVAVIAVLSIMGLMIALFVFTPIKQKLPGYGDLNTKRQAMELAMAYDSLESLIGPIKDKLDKGLAIAEDDNNFAAKMPQEEKKRFDSGYDNKTVQKGRGGLALDINDVPEHHHDHSHDHEHDHAHHGHDHGSDFDPTQNDQKDNGRADKFPAGKRELSSSLPSTNPLKGLVFFQPLKDAMVSGSFDLDQKHFGVDLICNDKNAPVKTVMDGTVINAEWDFDGGHVITIQHDNNLISIYKHNSVLLKKVGNFVKEGDAVAIVGNSGHQTSGPHLHFELWYNGFPIDPEDYLNLDKN